MQPLSTETEINSITGGIGASDGCFQLCNNQINQGYLDLLHSCDIENLTEENRPEKKVCLDNLYNKMQEDKQNNRAEKCVVSYSISRVLEL